MALEKQKHSKQTHWLHS